MPNQTQSVTRDKLYCKKCSRGLMFPVIEEGEAEYTENYQCNNCGHVATIPSVLIIVSQLFTGIVGGLFSLVLFIEELETLMTAFQFNISVSIATDMALLSIALIFIAGFTFTVFRAVRDIRKRKSYRIPLH